MRKTSKISKRVADELLKVIRTIIPDAEYAPEENFYNGTTSINFSASCGCYSEYTQEPCELRVFIKSKIKSESRIKKAEKAIDKYADSNLIWNGCECCGNYLWVDLRVFKKESR